jgi:hypothetical protein
MNLISIFSHPWPHTVSCFGGGGGGAAQAVQSAPVPTPAPAVTSDNPAVIQAEQDLIRQNLVKKSVKHTMLAGDTGGFQPGGANAANQPSSPATFKSKF